MDSLLPCPFCGGEAKTVLADTYPHRGMLHSWYVACKDSECGCELGFYGMDENGTCGTYETEAEAVAAWNTRYHSEFEKTVIKAWKEIKDYQERTCHRVDVNGYSFRFECSACGYVAIVHNCETRLDELPNYCPNCGARVTKSDQYL